ncbi:MAG TPA: hypothetical protein VN650_17555 [Gemmatimonadaceae bacterium]|nr:hypothetical protein [Gemmatimonadaceae bacterium]
MPSLAQPDFDSEGGEATLRRTETRLALRHLSVLLVASATLVVARPAAAQSSCSFICKPTISVEPAMIENHLFSHPTTRALATGAVQRLPSTTNLELIFAVGASTPIDRISLYGSVQWLPNASERRNPFTLYGASEIGDKVRANAPTASAGISLGIVDTKDTNGWLGVDAHIGDLYSSAARPHDSGAYTHKLDLGLVANWSLFAGLPMHTYMHDVALSTLLDYVATGLPKAGDEVPKGERVFLTGVHSASLIVGLAFPLASK